jgi:hypothetical protein
VGRTGFSVIIGSWKIIAISFPRNRRISFSCRPTSSRPFSFIEPSTMRPGGSTRPMMEKPVTVLPEPDSPTRPSTSPRETSKDTPSTDFTTPARVKKWVLSLETERTGVITSPA